jgi:hypothetical protein
MESTIDLCQYGTLVYSKCSPITRNIDVSGGWLSYRLPSR